MPRATYITEAIHKELKTCEGGFVDLRQLSFDEMLERRDRAMQMSMETRPNAKKTDPTKMIFESAMQWTRHFEFSRCIVDHNLEDADGKKLDFNNSMTLRVLDPRIGSEIERYIEEMNQEDDDESLEDFTRSLSSSSMTNGDTQKPPTEPS